MTSFLLSVTHADDGSEPMLAVQGELDLYTAREFQQRLRELTAPEPSSLVIDLTASTFVDSSACRALLHAAKTLNAHGGRVLVLYSDPEVARIMSVMGLDEFLDLVDVGADADAQAGLGVAV